MIVCVELADVSEPGQYLHVDFEANSMVSRCRQYEYAPAQFKLKKESTSQTLNFTLEKNTLTITCKKRTIPVYIIYKFITKCTMYNISQPMLQGT